MNSVNQKIIGETKLTDIFGRWPSFHDGYIDEIHFEPHSKNRALDIACRIWEMTDEKDAHGYFIRRNHTKTRIRFDQVEELEMKAIYAGVIIFEFIIEPAMLHFSKTNGWAVMIESSTDFKLKLQCHAIEIIEASPDLNPR